MKSSFNKKGDVESMIFVVVAIFIIGILFFFSNHVVDQLYTSLDDYFNSTTDYNNSIARDTLTDIHAVENTVWDYAFLFIALGLFLVLGLTAFSTRISPLFFWIYGVLSLVFLALAVILSSVWQDMSSKAVFAETLLRFPITDALLGTYYPTLIMGVVVIAMIFLFGKPPGGQGP